MFGAARDDEHRILGQREVIDGQPEAIAELDLITDAWQVDPDVPAERVLAGHLDAARELIDGNQWFVQADEPTGLAVQAG